jgi:hypothetical protein
MKPSLPASCWPALTRDLARTGAAGVPSWAPAPPRPTVSLTGAALLMSSSRASLGFMSTEVVHGQPVLM